MSITHDIFISYSRQNADIVNRVSNELFSAGFSVWIDKDGIESGDAFKSVIVKAIENCSTVIFFSSKSSNESYWTTKEISVAIYEGKNIIPIRLDDSKYNSEIKFDLINLDYIDMSNRSLEREGIQRLIKSLKNRQLSNVETEAPTIKENEEIIVSKRKSNLKFLFQYKGCLVSLTLCLVGIIIVPLQFISHNNSPISPPAASPVSEDLLTERPNTFSKDGFILDVNYYYSDCSYAIADSVTPDTINPQDFDYTESQYIKFMEEGIECVRKGDYSEAYNQFLKAANMNFADAMYNVSVSHLTGLGADVDTIKAIQWLHKAAEQNNEAAKIKLESLNK